MKILSITTAASGWFAIYHYPPDDNEAGWHEKDEIAVWAVVEDDKGQRIVGFSGKGPSGLRMSYLGNEECTFSGYRFESVPPTLKLTKEE